MRLWEGGRKKGERHTERKRERGKERDRESEREEKRGREEGKERKWPLGGLLFLGSEGGVSGVCWLHSGEFKAQERELGHRKREAVSVKWSVI